MKDTNKEQLLCDLISIEIMELFNGRVTREQEKKYRELINLYRHTYGEHAWKLKTIKE